MKRVISLLLIFAFMLSVVATAQEEQGELESGEAVMVKAEPVIMTQHVETRRYTGLIVSPATVNVVSRVSGDLQSVGFVEGDFVKRGQLLYSLDDVRFAAQVKSAEAKLAEAKAKLDYSKNNYNRINDLFSKDVTTRDELENALSIYDVAYAGVMEAEANLVLAQDDCQNSKIYAAIDGKIGATNYTVGNYITPNSGVLATVVQLNPIRVKFSISNRDFLKMFGTVDALKKCGKVQIVLADDSVYSKGGKAIYGTLDFIDNSANRSTDTVQMYFLFANEDYVLIPQSTVKVTLEKISEVPLAAIVPSAVMVANGQPYVYVVDANGKVESRKVKLSNVKQDLQLVESGLAEGEMVIVEGVHKVHPGSDVKIQGSAK